MSIFYRQYGGGKMICKKVTVCNYIPSIYLFNRFKIIPLVLTILIIQILPPTTASAGRGGKLIELDSFSGKYLKFPLRASQWELYTEDAILQLSIDTPNPSDYINPTEYSLLTMIDMGLETPDLEHVRYGLEQYDYLPASYKDALIVSYVPNSATYIDPIHDIKIPISDDIISKDGTPLGREIAEYIFSIYDEYGMRLQEETFLGNQEDEIPAGFGYIQVSIDTKSTSVYFISMNARKLGDDNADFSQNIQLNRGDVVQFQVEYERNGWWDRDVAATIKNTLPYGFEYTYGSFQINKNEQESAFIRNKDRICSEGVEISSYGDVSLTFTFLATVKTPADIYDRSLENCLELKLPIENDFLISEYVYLSVNKDFWGTLKNDFLNNLSFIAFFASAIAVILQIVRFVTIDIIRYKKEKSQKEEYSRRRQKKRKK